MHALVTLIAKDFIGLSVLLTAYTWWRVEQRQKVRFIVFAIVAAVGAIVLAKIGSKLYYDPRPFVTGHFTPYFSHGADNGFPSDHSLLAATLGFICYRYSRKLGLVTLFIGVLIGLARVIAGVHHLADVVGAFAFAAIAVIIVGWAEKAFWPLPARGRNRPANTDIPE